MGITPPRGGDGREAEGPGLAGPGLAVPRLKATCLGPLDGAKEGGTISDGDMEEACATSVAHASQQAPSVTTGRAADSVRGVTITSLEDAQGTPPGQVEGMGHDGVQAILLGRQLHDRTLRG